MKRLTVTICRRRLRTLAIESTCDESACAILDDRNILSQSVASQWDLLGTFNGVNPYFAAREHERQLPVVIQQTIDQSNLKLDHIDFISVAAGPGLSPCLKIGLASAKSLCLQYSKPLVAVNHLEAHILTARLINPLLEFPYLALLLSGGHSQFVLVKGVGNYQVLSSTLDDAVGEAYDKVAVLLNLQRNPKESFGACVERYAVEGMESRMFGVPMQRDVMPRENSGRFDFSFSGIKSAVRRKARESLEYKDQCDIAASFQKTVWDHLELQMKRAMNGLESDVVVRGFVFCGGVACNLYLRNRLEEFVGREYGNVLICPSKSLCSDNAAMIGWAGIEKFNLGHVDPLSIDFRSQWPLE